MKHFIAFIFILFLSAGCKPKVLSGNALNKKLKETMSIYLHKTLEPGVEFKIRDVIYFTDSANKIYLCHFNVSTHFKNKDTTGLMIATISNDFKNIVRTQ